MAIMASVGIGILYGFKVNLSINIVAMVNHTALDIRAKNTTSLVLNNTIKVSHKVTVFSIRLLVSGVEYQW